MYENMCITYQNINTFFINSFDYTIPAMMPESFGLSMAIL